MAAASRCAGLLVVAMLAGAWSVAPRPCAADADASATPAWLREVALNGFLSTSYSYNFNRPASGTNQLRVFDFDDNTFKLDVFELVVQRAVAKPRDAGFRVDLTLGSSVPRVTASAGLFRDTGGAAEDVDVHQAFASYVAPIGAGLRLDFGKFITQHGSEVIEGYDGWNDNATRSLLFGFAIPFTHLGARASYTFTPRVSALLMVVNGWDVARDNNSSKSIGGQLTWTPATPLTIYLSGMTGPERTGDNSDPRNLLDVVAILKPTSRLTLGANADWGAEKNGAGPGRDAHWSGVAGYARLGVRGPFAVSLRAEYFDDADGARTSTSQQLTEYTVTPELRLTPNLLVRGDARLDRSNRSVFEKGNAFVETQPTALLAAVYSF